MRLTIALCLMALPAAPALAETPYDAHVAGVGHCYAGATTDAERRACIGTGASACFEAAEDGQTTAGMRDCLSAEMQLWDGLLNAEYARARSAAEQADEAEREGFPEFAIRATQLRDAQRAWITFRDANCAMMYGIYGAGSLRLLSGADCLLQMTAERTLDLRGYAEELSGP